MAETLDFSAIKILLIGDVMIDHYLYGQINRISAEAPVPIVDIEDEEYRLGGAANVALNLLGLGAKTTLLTMLGDDEVGRKALHLMKENNLKTNHVLTSKLRTTSLKTRIFDDDRQVVRFDREDDADLSKEQEEMLLEELNALLKKEKFNAIILQDYNKGVLTKKIIKQILLITAKLNIPVVVDPKEYNFFEYQQIDLFKPNLKELSDALKIKIDPKNINSLRKAAEELKRKDLSVQANKRQNYFLIIVLLLTFVALGLIYSRFKITKKQKSIIEIQKGIVDDKNKEITDSINYAKRIQNSLLPTEKYIEKTIKRLNKKST